MQEELLSKIYRKEMLSKTNRWRFLAIFFVILFFFKMLGGSIISSKGSPYIARIAINGFISNDNFRNSSLEKIKNNDKIKAVIIDINSPGGTFVGGERLFEEIKKISKKKKTVVLIGEQATSAAYFAAAGSSHIIASRGSLVGSIGVLLQSFEVTELASKIGIKPILLKSTKYKASPNPLESLDKDNEQYLQNLIQESKNLFLSMVISSRKSFSEDAINIIKTGKVFIGERGLKLGLVDELGGFNEALKYLKKHKIEGEVKKVELLPSKKNLKNIINSLSGNFFSSMNGMLAIDNGFSAIGK